MEDSLASISHRASINVLVIAAWENASFIGDESAALRLCGAVLSVGSFVRVTAEVRKGGLWIAGPVEPIAAGSGERPRFVLESCGVVVYNELSKSFLLVRDYHTKPFIAVQFKLRAAFEGRIPSLPVEELVEHVGLWADQELAWVVEWKLKLIWPFVTADKIRDWNAQMKRLDPQIKALYRAAKAEQARRRSSPAVGAAASWGFPKGGAKIVRGRVEQPKESAVRELAEETQIKVDASALLPGEDVPRPDSSSVDRWFVLRLRGDGGAAPGGWDVAAIAWRTLEEIRRMPGWERFMPLLSRVAGEGSEPE